MCDSTYMFPRVIKFKDKNSNSRLQGLGESEMGRYYLMGIGISVWDNEKVLEMNAGDRCITI